MTKLLRNSYKQLAVLGGLLMTGSVIASLTLVAYGGGTEAFSAPNKFLYLGIILGGFLLWVAAWATPLPSKWDAVPVNYCDGTDYCLIEYHPVIFVVRGSEMYRYSLPELPEPDETKVPSR